MRYFLGVDVGNTKCHALIVDESGTAVGFGAGGPGNHEVLGPDGFRDALHVVVNAALNNAGLKPEHISGAGFGIAGYDWPSDGALMHQVIDTLGMNAPYQFVNDAMIGLIAGAKQGWGVAVSAGTSCNCRGRNRAGKEGRVTGNGQWFGEYGGGIELVYKAYDAMAREWSLRGPKTLITQIFVEHYQVNGVLDLLEGVARERLRMRATDAELVFKAFHQGDAVAESIIRWMSQELAGLAIGVIHQTEIESLEFEVVLAGSFYKGTPLIEKVMHETIHTVAPGATLVRLNAPPVVGAAMLGMEQVGINFTQYRDHIIETTNRQLYSV